MPQPKQPISLYEGAQKAYVNVFVSTCNKWLYRLYLATQTSGRTYTYERRCVMAQFPEVQQYLSSLPHLYKRLFAPRLAGEFAALIENYDHRVRALEYRFWIEERQSSLCLAMFRSVLTTYVSVYDREITSSSFKQNLVVQTLDSVPNLTSLFMVPLPEINRSIQLASMIHHLTFLTKFSYLNHCTDELVQQLALHCTRLEELYISDSRGVTNASVQHLLQLRKLEFLELDSTQIDNVQYGLLLSELPDIRNIKFSGTLDNIVNPLAAENLRTISHVHGHAEDSNILTQRCPNITNLHLQTVTGDLAGLAALTSLRSLFLTSANYATSHLNAVLTGIGPTLTELNLIRISNVNLQDILTHCRSLQILALSECSFLPLNAATPLNPALPHFRNLNSLHISRLFGDLTNFDFIRHYFNLKTIRLDSINIFTVEIVSEIIAFDNFANLEEFYIRETGYGALTMEAVNMLIEGCPQLKIIEGLRTCPHLNPVFIRELRRKLLADNLDIQIIW